MNRVYLIVAVIAALFFTAGEATANSHGSYGWHPGKLVGKVVAKRIDNAKQRQAKRQHRRAARQASRSHGSTGGYGSAGSYHVSTAPTTAGWAKGNDCPNGICPPAE